MKHLLQSIALLMVLLLVCTGFAACKTTPAPSETPSAPDNNPDTIVTTPRPSTDLVDATDSILLGEWNVTCEKGAITHLAFDKAGTVVVTTGKGRLGGSFVNTDNNLTLTIGSNTLTGTLAVDGDTIVFTADTDTLTLTKVQ